MDSNKEINIIVSGGGTGGHIFPAISIANAIKRRLPSANILFVGAEGRMEMEKVPAAGYRIEGLPVSGFDRKHLLRNIVVAYRFIKSKFKAKKIIRDFKPCIAIGVGGYASAPVLEAAQGMGIPTLIQEQNSYAGMTNKRLAKGASCICVAYEGMERFFPADKIVLTGNPVRSALLDCKLSQSEAKAKFGLDPDKLTVLVIGGSLGARTINRSIISGLPLIGKTEGVQVIWQSGKFYDEECREALKNSGVTNVVQMPFIANMDEAYRAADLVVSRAGASSISELQLLGKASILVPSPNVAEDHQTKNAQALANRGAAIMIADADAEHQLVAEALTTVTQADKLASISEYCGKMALRNSDDTIVDHVLELINLK